MNEDPLFNFGGIAMHVLLAAAIALLTHLPALAEISPGADSYNSLVTDVCQIKYTMQHYQEGTCYEIDRPAGSETFKLRTVLITQKLDEASSKDTMILIPGGPGESSAMLRYALNQKDILNAFIVHMRLNVVLFDPRGTGTSTFGWPVELYSTAEVNSELMADDLRAVADQVSPNKPVVLFAHSAGGATALRFAARYPNRVKKIVLVSTSVSPKQMAELNLKMFGFAPAIWRDFAGSAAGLNLDLKDLEEKYLWVEDVLLQQFKAKALNLHVRQDVKKNPLQLRDQLLQAIGSDPSGQAVAELVERNYQELKALPDQDTLVPPGLRAAKVEPRPDDDKRFKDAEWIKAAIMCGEGMSAEQAAQPSVFDGLNMAWFCGKIPPAAQPLSLDLAQVRAPVLFLAGARDSAVPLSAAKSTVAALPRAELVVDAKAGHLMFLEAPGTFYFSIERFLAPEGMNAHGL